MPNQSTTNKNSMITNTEKETNQLHVNKIDLNENAQIVLEKRYLKRDSDGNVIETPSQMFLRVAKAIAKPETLYGDSNEEEYWTKQFYQMMANLEFIPNSPTLMNAGINLEDGSGTGTLSACFVMELEDSMNGIMTTAKEMAMVQKFGGGTGFSLSKIRPKNAPIKTTHGKACGPINVLKHLSSVSKLVTQGGKRDGANMAVMNIHHPDINEFIECKTTEGEIHNFNISVGATHEFMTAVKENKNYSIKDPQTGELIKEQNAGEIFDQIIEGAWKNGEPGVVFVDWVNHKNPTPHIGEMTATNPCGEQPLLPYESCNLGSINLDKFVTDNNSTKELDWSRLGKVARTSARFLDNVIDANSYSVDKIKKMTRSTRKTGLGVMGFADLLIDLNIAYDSEEGLNLGKKIMRFIKDEADSTSIKLADERGVFPAYPGSIYDSDDQPKMRNACRLTVAPTGTISMIAGCSSGIEPLFALCYHKHNILGGESLLYVDEKFEALAKEQNFYSEELMEYLANGGSLQERDDVPESAKKLFVTAGDISPEMHVRMQGVFQESVDAAISKTINFPNSATKEDVRKAYILAWELGCKGITVYRSGSREKEVLTVGEDKSSGNDQESDKVSIDFSLVERQRPSVITGVTERIRTSQGNLFVTVNYDENEKPFEVFATLGKAGSTESAHLEAISRLVTMSLRAGVGPNEIIGHLRGITDDPIWDAGTLVRSAPDAVALVLSRHLTLSGEENSKFSIESEIQPQLFVKPLNETVDQLTSNNQSCPECNIGTLIPQEGCMKCVSCGYNKCE